MKVLVLGDWHSELHEEAVFRALRGLRHEAFKFAWHQYFQPPAGTPRLASLALRAQNKFMIGPAVDRVNRDLIDFAKTIRPDVIFVYRGTHIYSRTIRRLREELKDVIIVGYNNDDPFSPIYPKWMWRHFKSCIPEYDLVLAYRQHNVEEYLSAGARRVELLRSWFIPGRNHPAQLSDAEMAEYGADVVFVGHYEDDGRLEYLEEIARRGWRLRIFGPGREWNEILAHSALLADQVPVRFISGTAYNNALCGAKIALCFFSKLNRDTYTRRCFEIPASGTLMLSAYTDDVATLYNADQEAVFFTDIDGMCSAIDGLLGNEKRRRAIAQAGTRRVWRDGHDVESRMRTLLGWIDEIMSARR